jgi:transposase
MQRYRETAWERAMKVREVILRAMAKRITWWQAAEILGITDRSMRRWKRRYEEYGYDGLLDRRRGKPSPKRVPLEEAEAVLRLYPERYPDLNVRHFHEKLREEHGIKLGYTWVKLALQGAGLVKKGRKRGVHRKRRVRRPLPGMLLHLDGSEHRWFQDNRWYDLIEVLDDVTSETYYAQLVEEESTRTVMAALKAVIEQKGRFCALYSDRASHFFETAQAGGPVDRQRLTQVGRASCWRSRKNSARHVVEMTHRGKRGKVKRRTFPLFPPRLEIRPQAKTPDFPIPTASTAADSPRKTGAKKKQNRTDHVLQKPDILTS